MRFFFLFLNTVLSLCATAQIKKDIVREAIGTFLRADSLPIVFNIEISQQKGTQQWIIRNAQERLRVTDIRSIGDSIFVDMPFFESVLRLRQFSDGVLSGLWVKGTTASDAVLPVRIVPGKKRFLPVQGKAKEDLSGRWAVQFRRQNGTTRAAMAEFKQQGDRLTGTFLTPTGDYRYLEGIVTGNRLQLSCFDGSHAYYFTAKVESSGRLTEGVFASGATYLEHWTAVKDPSATIDLSAAAMTMRPGEDRIRFRFPDLDSNLVSLQDDRFRDKVVVIQIMGSWCPNCMDETAFLSDYYRKNRKRGVEMIALAYEYNPDFNKARRSLEKFRRQFDVQYPMLITGVTSADTLRTEKTLPELSPIRAFPTTIFIGKDGRVKKIHAGFSGPATGQHFLAYKQEFEETITALLKEN